MALLKATRDLLKKVDKKKAMAIWVCPQRKKSKM